MATIPLFMGNSRVSTGASTTQYGPVGLGVRPGNATETNMYLTHRSAGTLSNLYFRLSSNDRGASTMRVRVNVGDGNQNVSIGASATGEFEDTSNTDAIAAGDEFALRLVTGAGGTTFVLEAQGWLFAPTTNTAERFVTAGGGGISTASTTFFNLIGGIEGDVTASENGQEQKFQTAGTLSNGIVLLRTNTRSTNSTFRSRVNNGNGNIAITIASTDTSGFLEDTSNTDTIAANDLVNTSITLGTGTGTLRFFLTGADFITTNSKFMILGGLGIGRNQLANVTSYSHMAGNLILAATTEAFLQSDPNIAFTGSNATIYVSAITMTDASTWRLRINGGNGNQVISSITTTGRKEDTTNTDAIVSGDDICWEFITGATGTSATLSLLSMMGAIAAPAPPATATSQFFMLMGIGT